MPPLTRRYFLGALAVAALAAARPVRAHSAHDTEGGRPTRGMAPPKGQAIGGAFELLDQNGRPYRLGAASEQRTLVFFGFTQCPHACPTTLAAAQRFRQVLAPARRPRIVFITLDPERDTPAVLKQYVGAFDNGIIALTGSRERIEAVANGYRVNHRRVPAAAGYTIEHSAYLYLLDRGGQVVRLYPQGIDADVIANEINQLEAARAVST